MEQQLGTITTDISLLKDKLHKLADRVRITEKTLTALEPGLADQTSIVSQLRRQVEQLQDHAEDTAGRACWNNMGIVRLPEGTEVPHLTQFVETWLCTVVSMTGLSGLFTVERAHHLPTKRPIPGALLRTIVAKILNCRDQLLRAAREKAPLIVEGPQVSLFKITP
ncbi:hypothetical protein NDU88_007371 [Pleurodeles waltl]|uniref:Uncharacterized protein n=1 Tax=Pleurodeles waltl TaxID=8319 RepID=A0AAV7U3F2_PLEWA|nr:hypothetical protein NDU88_007371 [Pleurodeles waltl]